MKIFITRNLSKNAKAQHAIFDPYGRIDQDEFKRLANFILEGIPVSINEVPVATSIKGMPKYGYEIVDCTLEQLPASLVAQLQAETKRIHSFSQALYNYNQSVKEKVEDYINRRSRYIQNLEVRNQAYKDIQNCAIQLGITAYSPCNRTFWEVKAERNFFGMLPTDDNITDEQIEFVKLNAHKFGLEIPEVRFYIASREAKRYDNDGNIISNHGRTEEIQRVLHSKENTNQRPGQPERDWSSAFHPNNLPEDFMVSSMGTTRAQFKEVFDQLMWFLKLPIDQQDEFLAEGYVRCPHCGQITRVIPDETDIDYTHCEYCEGILEDFDVLDTNPSSNDMLFYGTDISDSYSDLEDVRDYIDDNDDDDCDYEFVKEC